MTLDEARERHDRAVIIGDLVRRTREDAGQDQRTVAALAGVSERFLRSVEHGKPTVRFDALLAVLDALGLELLVRPRAVGDAVERR